jgi:hypothetical protein
MHQFLTSLNPYPIHFHFLEIEKYKLLSELLSTAILLKHPSQNICLYLVLYLRRIRKVILGEGCIRSKFCDKNVSNSLDSSLVIIEIVIWIPFKIIGMMASNYQIAAYEYITYFAS